VARKVLALAFALGAGVVLSSCQQPDVPAGSGSGQAQAAKPPAPVGAHVYFVQGLFAPATVVIRPGQSVEWSWEPPAVPGDVVFGKRRSPVLEAGNYYRVFDRPGVYHYVDTFSALARGTVVVRP